MTGVQTCALPICLQFFQRQLGESGILDALVEKGVEENDTILIGDYQFDYIF